MAVPATKKPFKHYSQMNDAEKEEFYKTHPEMKDTAKLRAMLDNERRRPNTVSLKEFEKFIPIFQNPPQFQSMEEGVRYEALIIRLTKLYSTRFNLYKPTYVYNQPDDKDPILVIPPVFVQMAAIQNTPENQAAVKQFRNKGFSDIPAHAAQAEAVLYEAMRRTIDAPENRERYRKIRSETRGYFDTFMESKFPGSTRKKDARNQEVLPKNGNSSSYLDSTEDEFI